MNETQRLERLLDEQLDDTPIIINEDGTIQPASDPNARGLAMVDVQGDYRADM
ncbi:hypothetical protein ACFQY4_16930 [Catellatospora bangladeshensis]|uniref:Uncharacterized protein n=1 Tax=Catellatospora bangladeshensis TaxID=310355 RepID=A0A8J3NLP2_9ACTN|nr:hypothetical protein [Catellatospora bangladeshensis]GIF84206.1 hypothetical protein Cba03nite_55550 [Catellatospora bangladeshensis]